MTREERPRKFGIHNSVTHARQSNSLNRLENPSERDEVELNELHLLRAIRERLHSVEGTF